MQGAHSRLDDVLRAAAKLPTCDGAAKLHALVARVVDAIEQQQDPAESIDALARAATDALDADPWVQFGRATERLRRGSETPSISSASPVPASTTSLP